MSFTHPPSVHGLSYEDKAIFSRLAALNATFEAARVGKPAQSFAHRALYSDAILEAYLRDIRVQKNTQ